MRFWKSKCERQGHDWFPDIASEFYPMRDTCMRCDTQRVTMPWGRCIGMKGGHPISEHYDENGNKVSVKFCSGPR